MRAKITRGANVRGAVNYDLNLGSKRVEGKTARFIGGNMSGNTADELVAEFESIRQLRPDIAKPVWKEALRVTAGEDISAEKWHKIALSHMAQLGLDPEIHPHMITQHVGEDHIHIMALRIAVDGSIYHGKNENLIASRDCQRLEKDFNLVRTTGAKYRVDESGKHHIIMPQKSKCRIGEIKMQERTGEIPPRQHLQEIIATAVKDLPTQQVFEKRLVDAGVCFKKSTGGYSYKIAGVAFKGSQLGTAFKWAQLQKQFTSKEQAAKLQPEADLQTFYSSRRAAWESEAIRRSKYRASRSVAYSICQISYAILPRPLGEAVQIAADIMRAIQSINDWREAHEYRKQVENLTARMNRIKADLLAEKSKAKAVKPKIEPFSASMSGVANAPTTAVNKNIPSSQQPAFDVSSYLALSVAKKQEHFKFIEAVQKNYPAAKIEGLNKLCSIASDMKKLTIQNDKGTLSADKFNSLTDHQQRQIKELIKDLPGAKIKLPYDPGQPAIEIDGQPVPEIEKKLFISPQQPGTVPTQGITRTGGRR